MTKCKGQSKGNNMAKQIGAAVLPKGNSAQGSYRSQRAQNGQISVEDVDAKIQLPGIDWQNFLTHPFFFGSSSSMSWITGSCSH